MTPYQFILSDGEFVNDQGAFMATDFESAENHLREIFAGLKNHTIWLTCFATGRNGIIRLKPEQNNG